MSDYPEPEKSADPIAQHPSQPPAYQTEEPYPPPDQYPLPDQKYPPTAQYPPAGQYPPPGQQYPPTAQYNQQQAGLMVVTAQPAPVATRNVYVANQTPARDYLKLTMVTMVVCFFCGSALGPLLLVPALICSMMASRANSSHNYDTAKKLGRASLVWNIFVYIFNTLATIAIVVGVVVYVVQLSANTRCSITRFGRTVCS